MADEDADKPTIPTVKGIVIDLKHIVAVAALLGLGGVGVGGVGLISNSQRFGTENLDNLATKEQFDSLDAKIDALNAKLDKAALSSASEQATNDSFRRKTEKALDDLEARLRVLESRRISR